MSVADPLETPNRGLITLAVMVCTTMVALDTTIANVALPHVMGSISAGSDQITWVLTSYIVAAAIVTPLTGWLDAKFGRKTVLLVCVAGFVAASMLCGMSTSLFQIVLFRLLQGVFGAPITPLAQAQLLDMNPPERHGQAMAIFGVGSLLGPIMGPALGGYLTEHFSWRWVFYVNVPVGAVALMAIFFLLPQARQARRRSFDFMGFGMLALFVASFQLMMDRGQTQDWFSSPEVWTEAVVAGISLWMFVFASASAKHPFFDPRLLADPNFLASQVMSVLLFMIMGSSLSLMPPLLQNVMNYPVQTAGLVMMPRGGGSVVGMFLAGRLVAKVDNRLLILIGLGILSVSGWQMSQFDLSMTSGPVLVSGFTQGVGMGLIMVPISAFAFATLPPLLRSEGTALVSVIRNIAQSAGISMMQALLQRHTQAMHSSLAGGVIMSDPVVANALAATNPASPMGAMALDAEITRQAQMVAYVDNFKLMMIVTLACMPILLFMRKPAYETVGQIDAH